jgi:hypothetical protein
VAVRPEPAVVAARPEPAAEERQEPAAEERQEPVVAERPEPVVAERPEPVVAERLGQAPQEQRSGQSPPVPRWRRRTAQLGGSL